ncbi:MAG: helix-turn-helix transcriptional regulator [Anaerolineales bacterium]|nr:helix-turn-helix transcriptional regulator [Anaerolineales bacterium]MCS7248218.1 helix-turn-helix transcriptional regulator [Anaerolineales bacterium]MDW8162031.1 helix-turn-helix transcriptional regulator [Anaerolineales bacterium]MDW8448248.1 helix-turn-helix transcriptional regulator [Anaerolineales bacterium]
MNKEGFSLTQRECEVLALLAEGKRNSEIAEALGTTENTVEAHLKHIFSKLGVSNRVQAVLYYISILATNPEKFTGSCDDNDQHMPYNATNNLGVYHSRGDSVS